mmetsp:Transcript_126872/g.283594  ORF Transcript_126872/g.283594 Transcript_126872/m.283594 type:complete len:322 (-) Transcript_126872:62-1027(-)
MAGWVLGTALAALVVAATIAHLWGVLGGKSTDPLLASSGAATVLAPAEATLTKSGAPYPRLQAVLSEGPPQLWSAEELAVHDGRDQAKPLLLAVLGEVFDVGPGERHYGPQGGYSVFSGCDASRAFSGSELSGERRTSQVEDLGTDDLESIFSWRSFYRSHEEYRFVGVLNGRHFDDRGRPTPELLRLEARHAAESDAERLREQLRQRFKSCNSRQVGGESHFEIWCDDDYHGPGSLPMHLYYRLPGRAVPASTGQAADGGDEESSWCACLAPAVREAADREVAELVQRPQPGRAAFRFVDYPECEQGSQRCRRKKGSQPP